MTDFKALEASIMDKVKGAVHDTLTSLEDNEPTIDTVVSAAFDSAGFPAEVGTAASHLLSILIGMGANAVKAPAPAAPTVPATPAPVVAPVVAPAAPVTAASATVTESASNVVAPTTVAPPAAPEVVQGPTVIV